MVSTRKSDNFAGWSKAACGALVALGLCAGGCATFQQKDPVAAYEQTQQRLTEQRRYPVQQSSFEPSESQGPKLPELADFSPSSFTKKVKEATGFGPNPEEARQIYAEADKLFREAATLPGDERRKPFIDSSEKFIAAAKLWPDSALEEDAMFMAGEGYFFADNYPKSNNEYEKLLKKYPNSRYLDRVEAKRFAIAQHWLARHEKKPPSFYEVNVTDKTRPWRDTRGNALRIFDKIRFDDPTGRLADDATLALGNTHFRAGEYLKADEYYTDLRKTFPASEYQFDAHFLGLKAKLLSYRGPDYAGDLLDEAEQLIVQIRRQFPDKAAEKREYLDRASAEVRFRQAERLWTRVVYHRLRSEYGSARYYAQQIINDYSDTPFNDNARQLMVDSRDKPATPPQQLSWLVNLFPESDPVKPLLKSDSAPTKRR